jgi:DNA-binding NarL/FixJ family response regulator
MRGSCVILADSHQNTLEGIRGLLGTMFETILMVADEKSLFETVEKLKPDLAIVDLSLPVPGEVNVVSKLRSLYPDLKFIVLSVHDDETVLDEIMSAGAMGFVLKRCVSTDLHKAVREVRRGRIFVSPSVRR